MGYSRKVEDYPDFYGKLFEKAIESGRHEINLGKSSQARNFRHRLHAWRRAAKSQKIAGYMKLDAVEISLEDGIVILSCIDGLIDQIEELYTEPDEAELERYLDEMEGKL